LLPRGVIYVAMETHAAEINRIEQHIAALVAERQQLRASDAEHEVLERNRAEIVRSQWELAAALIARHRPAAAAAA
jgi:hypothetical protein